MTIRMLFFVAVVYVHVQNEVVIYHLMITCLITHTHLTMLKISYIIKGLSKAPLQMCQTSQIIFFYQLFFFPFRSPRGAKFVHHRCYFVYRLFLLSAFFAPKILCFFLFSIFYSTAFLYQPFFFECFDSQVAQCPHPPQKKSLSLVHFCTDFCSDLPFLSAPPIVVFLYLALS